MKKFLVVFSMILIMPILAFAVDDTIIVIGVETPPSVNATGGVIFAPNTTYEATKPLVIPSTVIPSSIPQISFGTVKAIEAPIVDARVKPLQKDDILFKILWTKKTKIDNLFKTLIKGNQTINAKGYQMTNVRVIVFEKLSTKVWSTGGNISASGAGYVGTGSMGGSGGLIPTYGRMTADSLFIVQYILVVDK